MLTFRHALEAVGISPAAVCVLRHQDARADPGRNPYQLFLKDRPAFDEYQAVQTFENRSRLRADYWAAFVGHQVRVRYSVVFTRVDISVSARSTFRGLISKIRSIGQASTIDMS